jgi:uncharacterized membrane protein YccC
MPLMNNLPQDIQRFLYGQHFADGLRMSVLIILPALLAAQTGYYDIGLTLSIGALCVSISDTPGPTYDKTITMLVSSFFIFLVAIATGFMRMNVYVMGLSLTVLAFFFAMFTIYGARANLLGTSLLLLMALEMDKAMSPRQILENGLILAGGALWYSSMSILILRLLKSAQRALGECIRETAAYLALRGLLYDTKVPLDEVYTRLMAQQVILNDKQNEVRDLLFKNKKIMKQASRSTRAMVLTLDEIVDFYEKISASHVAYQAIRERYGGTDVLQNISLAISRMADILDGTGAAIQYNIRPKSQADISIMMDALTDEIVSAPDDKQRPVLDSLLVNIQNMYKVVADLQHYFTDGYTVLGSKNSSLEHSRFAAHQSFDISLFRYNFSFGSLTFRHSIRMAVACLLGYIISRWVMHGHHSYWLLITIIFVLKPSFSLTRERNINRILGTLIGGAIGVLILVFIHNNNVLFACMFIGMLVTYSFQRHRYLIAVIFMTPYLLILFHFLHVGLLEVAEERIADTIAGCIIALAAGYLILPDWESAQIKSNVSHMLHANYRYLCTIRDSLMGTAVSATEYRLIRKEVYVSSSNLSAAIQRMKAEPERTRKSTKEIQQFSLLNHLLTSHIAAAGESLAITSHQSSIQWADRSITILQDTIRYVDEGIKPPIAPDMGAIKITDPRDAFESIYKDSSEIEQISQVIAL